MSNEPSVVFRTGIDLSSIFIFLWSLRQDVGSHLPTYFLFNNYVVDNLYIRQCAQRWGCSGERDKLSLSPWSSSLENRGRAGGETAVNQVITPQNINHDSEACSRTCKGSLSQAVRA